MSSESHRPNKLWLGLLVPASGVLALIALTITLDYFSQPATVTSAVQPNDPDADLGNAPRTLTVRTDLKDNFLFKEQVVRADGTTVVKTVFESRQQYVTFTNVPYVQYEFFRADGTLERNKLVFPETGLGASVYCRWRETTFDTDGKTELFARYIREDGTIGNEHDKKTGWWTEYRADGKTPRRKGGFKKDADEHETIQYRLDGKTIWWSSIHRGVTKVYFDHQGNPVNKQFKVNYLVDGYSHGPTKPPLAHTEHIWMRDDGKTPAYKQTWYIAWETKDHSFDGIGNIEVYGGDGKTVTAVIKLKLQTPKHGVFMTTVEHRNADGSKLVRTYRSPGNRESEETFDAAGKSVKKEHFNHNDRFNESFDNFMFEGFGPVNMHGEHDTDAHDI
ncbi:MAG: hypothetical protein K2W95_35490 [Candidatus Obscuribacterales bacterium]|nr:hypothetical protein [Candidatus Obscuribacterales bacterium]